MRRLRVDMDELAAAFDDASDELKFYLDLETGKVELFTDEMPAEVDEASLPEWQQEALAVARAVEEGYGTRYIEIPRVESHEAYRDMEDFIGTVANRQLQDRLYRAISGRGAFRYFKDVLLDYPQERERWFAFRDARMRQRVLDWLESEEIEPIGDEPSSRHA